MRRQPAKVLYDPYADEMVATMPAYGYCALCGDAGWEDGNECRRIKAAREAGTFVPQFDAKTGEKLTRQ